MSIVRLEGRVEVGLPEEEEDVTVRVMRVMEYRYTTAEAMVFDMERWAVQGTHVFNPTCTITSTTLPLEIVTDDDTIAEDD